MNLAEEQQAIERKEPRNNAVLKRREKRFTSESFLKRYRKKYWSDQLNEIKNYGYLINRSALLTASCGVAARMIFLLTSQVCNPTTGFPILSASAISERVP